MDVYTYSDQQSAQDACNEIWLIMQAAGIQDLDAYGLPVDPQITDRWDDPKQDADGNWTVFVPDDSKFQLDVPVVKPGQVDAPKLEIAQWKSPVKDVVDGVVYKTVAGKRAVDVPIDAVAEVAVSIDSIKL